MFNIITDIPQCKKQNCNNLCKPAKWTKSGFTEYCSRKCIGNYISKGSISRIYSVLPIPEDIVLNYKSVDYYDFNNKIYKRILADYSCEICHNSHWNNKRIYLEIDHIDGDKKNNRLENLRVLCRNCHSQTETFTRRKNKKVSFKYRIYGPIHINSYKRNFESLDKETKRKIIFNEQNNSCLFCGVKQWCDKPLAFEMDHISGNRSDNRRDNLRILCPNCHASTDTFRKLNDGAPDRNRTRI